jgi:hypothetical protein
VTDKHEKTNFPMRARMRTNASHAVECFSCRCGSEEAEVHTYLHRYYRAIRHSTVKRKCVEHYTMLQNGMIMRWIPCGVSRLTVCVQEGRKEKLLQRADDVTCTMPAECMRAPMHAAAGRQGETIATAWEDTVGIRKERWMYGRRERKCSHEGIL